MPYFNHRIYPVAGYWDRFSFSNAWWNLTQRDPFATPPYYPNLRRALNPKQTPHIARLDPYALYIDAIPHQPRGTQLAPQQMMASPTTWERAVATIMLLIDPRRRDSTATFALLRSVNDEDTLELLFGHLMELMMEQGIYRLIGPVGLSPHLGSGLLQNQWHLRPPRHTANNPPYMPELIADFIRPFHTTHLYHLPITNTPKVDGPATLTPLNPAQLSTDLLPLLIAATEANPHFPPPDTAEAAFLHRWLNGSFGWVATIDSQPVGFIWLQADAHRRLRLTKGGRPLWRRALWLATERLPTKQGTLFMGGILPSHRRQGIATQLLQQAQHTAHQRGWQTLHIGPIATKNLAATTLLKNANAQPQQTYNLYEYTL